VAPTDLPVDALLRRYADAGAYTDCWATRVDGDVDLAAYVEAFYTGRVFKLERLLLRWFAARPSSDADAGRVARGEQAHFAAWSVEGRAGDQLLMCDMAARTRSWFMVAPGGDARAGGGANASGGATRLYFGSAVVPRRDAAGAPRMGGAFRALLGFHRVYSRVLLSAARARILRGQARATRG
jgi:hypothetical protein